MIFFVIFLQILDILQLFFFDEFIKIIYGWLFFIYIAIAVGMLYLRTIYVNDKYNYIFWCLAIMVTLSVFLTQTHVLNKNISYIICTIRIVINVLFYYLIRKNKTLFDNQKKEIDKDKFNCYFDENEELSQDDDCSFSTAREFFDWLRENVFIIKDKEVRNILNNGWVNFIVFIYVIVLIITSNINYQIIKIIFFILVFLMCCIKVYLRRKEQSFIHLLFQLVMIEVDLIFSYYFETASINLYYILIHLLLWMPFITSQLRICDSESIN